MKFTFHAFFLLLISVMQVTLADVISVFGIKPNFFLVYAIVYALLCEKKEAAATGAVFGLALDILAGRFLGAHTILLMITCFFASHLCETVLNRKNIFISAVIVAVFTLIYETIYYVFAFSVLKELRLGGEFAAVLGGECLYNIAFSFAFYVIMTKSKFLKTDL